ncbi:MAG: hypothetical protein K9H64_21720 [Bacteroidales bacterium]|nr:hypothetical protein [Bacteroidales bacterium]MCF8458640.1 hypothetical protein [Bacteroidales bacterium]
MVITEEKQAQKRNTGLNMSISTTGVPNVGMRNSKITKTYKRELSPLAMPTDADFVNNLAVPNTASNAMQNYTQEYKYDELGNIEQMRSVGDWTRDYYYETPNNRLKNHDNQTDVYDYDEHGNCIEMPHLPELSWDYKDELKEVTLNASNHKAYYVYDASGERVRKVVDKGSVVEQRLYLGGFEIYRKTISGTLDYERETLKITEGRNTIAQLETKTVENGNTISTPTTNQRFQYSNHLGSACLELDSNAAIISYEEYHPFGTTSYRSGSSETEVSLKRYKYVGKERDEETGLYYYGARYYAAWIARFVSVDPLQHKYPYYTPYQYAGNKPITYLDLDGLEEYDPMGLSVKDPRGRNQAIPNDAIPLFNDQDQAVGYFTGKHYFGWVDDGNNQGYFNSEGKGHIDYAGDYYSREDNAFGWALNEAATSVGEDFIELITDPKQYGKDLYASIKDFDLGKTIDYLAGLDDSEKQVMGASIIFGLLTARPSKNIWSTGPMKNSLRNAVGHWMKHGAEFPDLKSAREYIAATHKFLTKPPKGTIVKLQKYDIIMYDPKSNTFAAMKVDGTPKTMFKPSTKSISNPEGVDLTKFKDYEEWFNAQPGKVTFLR